MMEARKRQVGWRAVWRDFMKWFDVAHGGTPPWSAQKRKIASLVEANLAKKKKAKPEKT